MIKKFIVRFLNNLLKDENLTVGSLSVMHPETIKTDSIVEQTAGAGVTITGLVCQTGTQANIPAAINSHVGQLYYVTDQYQLLVHIGVGQAGADGKGWYNLKLSQYA